MLTPPMGKPEGGMLQMLCLRATTLKTLLIPKAKITKTNINLLDESFLVSRSPGLHQNKSS